MVMLSLKAFVYLHGHATWFMLYCDVRMNLKLLFTVDGHSTRMRLVMPNLFLSRVMCYLSCLVSLHRERRGMIVQINCSNVTAPSHQLCGFVICVLV
eukprot:m.437799 g.437799  ORF g.437799 m.437799 type:complete len:97 (+) comp18157_c0_seq1:1173-1463(+)